MFLIKKQDYNLKEHEITSESYYLNRRNILRGTLGIFFSGLSKSIISKNHEFDFEKSVKRPLTSLKTLKKYNNFFEFGTTKNIWKQAQKLNTDNWSIQISGGKKENNKLNYEDILKKFRTEERIYRFRCVEAWSMVVPWQGFQLADLIRFLEPEKDTKYVEFETFYDPKVAKNQNQNWYPWPYKEVITIDEALNKLAFVASGVYGKNLPKQNGAPLRLVMPWKYGFKSIKSISKINFIKKRSVSFWETVAPEEYGFWANVNPKVPHKRWSQAYERDIETGKKHPTKLFNGYGPWVSNLYSDIDNKKLFY